jgi:hypothetical protein
VRKLSGGVVGPDEDLMKQEIRRVFMLGKDWQRKICYDSSSPISG